MSPIVGHETDRLISCHEETHIKYRFIYSLPRTVAQLPHGKVIILLPVIKI
jgi:hypothetical protein